MITGPMFSGKTTVLFAVQAAASRLHCGICALKPALDHRYQRLSPEIVSHTGTRIPAFASSTLRGLLDTLDSLFSTASVVLVDEAHMFNPEDLTNFLDFAVDHRLLHVVLAGVDHGTDRQAKFPGMSAACGRASSVHRLMARCSFCSCEAPYSVRTTPVIDNNWVGGAEAYSAVCRFHYHRANIQRGDVFSSALHPRRRRRLVASRSRFCR